VTTPEPPPEAQLIHRLREEMFPAVSMREAAKRAGMGTATWVQAEQGYRKVTAAVTIPIRATDDKLAAMAFVVGATPQQLRETGREIAADMLQRLINAAPDAKAQMVEKIRQSKDFSERQKRALIDMVLREDE